MVLKNSKNRKGKNHYHIFHSDFNGKGKMIVLLSSFCSPDAVSRHKTAWKLLSDGARRIYGINDFCDGVMRNEAGKPFHPGYPEIRFGISHTKNAAFCVFADREIGLDCEEKRRVSERVREAYLGGAKDDTEALERWTKLESLVKLKGVRFADISYERDVMEPEGICFERLETPLGKDFIIHVCYFRKS